MKPERGLFISFEGLDGAGKTTQLVAIRQSLEEEGYPVVQTREPGGTRVGDGIRELLLHPEFGELSPRTEVLLYAASRAQHVDEVIRPALAKGNIVLCDRFVDASIAYQGAGLELGEEHVARVNEFALSGLSPDLTILFDLPWADARVRLLETRGEGQLDRIEQRDEAFFSRVRESFLRIAKTAPTRVYVVDARKSKVELAQEIKGIVWNYMKSTNSHSGR